jgi:hypothetical protein
MKKRNIRDFPIMPHQCSSCPLRTDKRGRYPDPRLAASVIERCVTRASQICHHPRLHDKPETHLCRGARDFQITIFYRLGFLKEPTDAAWKEKAEI